MTANTRRLVTAALAAALIGALAAGCGKGSTSTPAAGSPAAQAADAALLAPTDVAVAQRLDLATGVPVSGTLSAGWEARVTSPFDDVVEDVLVREGQRVSKGQVLARFRDDIMTTGAASAAARLKSAAADYERQKNLLAEGAVSQRDVEAAEASWRAAQAENSSASKRLADATVRAPGAGAVTERSVQSGTRVGAGDPLFVVSNTSELEFEASVPSEYVRLVRPGSLVRLDVAGFETGSIHGRVARVNTQADPATRQVKVYVNVPNRDGRLVGGLFATGSVVTHEARKVLAVPSAAIRHEGDQASVWVLADGKLEKKPVKAGLRDERRDLVEVLSGLTGGEQVITGPVEGFVPGRQARVSGKES
jgi:membrane fusion protein (multidrug efflux system)